MVKPTSPPLSQLGSRAALPASPDEAVLERIANPHADTLYLARFTQPEFTSICPVTGQADFAHLVIDYAPEKMDRREQEPQALSRRLPQSWRLPRGLHGGDRQAAGGDAGPQMAAHRGLLVSARRHADRRFLADGRGAQGAMGSRDRRCELSG